MKLVVVESPYAGDVEANVAYARCCLADCLRRDEAPFASHLIYTQVLDDTLPEERYLGVHAGFAWGAKADRVVFYVDRGISKGMIQGFHAARDRNMFCEVRALDRAVTGEDLLAFCGEHE